jgi:hypothetical protein
MARKVHGGVVGGSGVGSLSVTNTTFTASVDQDITIDPAGTGIFKIAGDAQLQDQGDLRFADADSSNYVAFQAPTTVASNVTWTLPDTDGSIGQALTTDGNATLTFSDIAITITDQGVSSSNFNLLFTDETATGTLDEAFIDNGVITYQPSTEILTVSAKMQTVTTETVQTGNYTLALIDRDQVVAMNNSAAATVTVPPNSSVAFPIGSIVYISRVNTGTVTLAAGSGVTLSTTGELGPGEEIVVRKRATNEWSVLEERRYAREGSGGTQTNQTVAVSHSYTSTGADTFVVS